MKRVPVHSMSQTRCCLAYQANEIIQHHSPIQVTMVIYITNQIWNKNLAFWLSGVCNPVNNKRIGQFFFFDLYLVFADRKTVSGKPPTVSLSDTFGSSKEYDRIQSRTSSTKFSSAKQRRWSEYKQTHLVWYFVYTYFCNISFSLLSCGTLYIWN